MSPDHLASWFEDRRPHFHDLARHIVGSRDDADDVVQDAFLKALAGFGDAIRSPGAWMTTMVRNLAFDHLRHRRVVRDFAARADPQQDAVPSVEDALARRLEAAAVARRIVDVLDERDALALLLRVVFDEDHASLARRFGKSEGAMRVALHRDGRRVREAATGDRPSRSARDDERVARTFAVCWQAIEQRDASVLHAWLDGAPSAPSGGALDAPPVRVSTVQRDGRYVLALRQGERLICVLPIGVEPIDSLCTTD